MLKAISVIKKLNVTFLCSSLLTIYKSFIRSYLDYGDVIHYQSNSNRLSEKIKSIKYNEELVITGAIRETSREIESGIRS